MQKMSMQERWIDADPVARWQRAYLLMEPYLTNTPIAQAIAWLYSDIRLGNHDYMALYTESGAEYF